MNVTFAAIERATTLKDIEVRHVSHNLYIILFVFVRISIISAVIVQHNNVNQYTLRTYLCTIQILQLSLTHRYIRKNTKRVYEL